MGSTSNPKCERTSNRPVIRNALAHPPAETTWAHRTCSTAEGHDMVLAAVIAVQVGETSAQDPAVHVPVQLRGHELGQGAPAGLVGPLLLEGQQMLLHHLVERGVFGLPARVHRAGG